MADTKISDFGDIPALDIANDRVVVIDASASGTNKNKLISPSGLMAMVYDGVTYAPPITVMFKNVTVLTSGTPSDVASVAVPAWLTRYRAERASGSCFVYAETASGTLAGGSWTVYASSGGANQITNSFAGPTAQGATNVISSSLVSSLFSSGTLYLRQTANSANSGTVSVYLTLVPCL